MRNFIAPLGRLWVLMLVGGCWPAMTPAGTVADETTRRDVGWGVEPSVWFDPSTGARPVELADDRPRDSIHRDSEWTKQPVKKAPATTTPSSAFSISQVIGYALLFLTVGAMSSLVLLLLRRYQPSPSGTLRRTITDDAPPDHQTIARMEMLPEAVRRTDVNLRSETMRLIEAGRYHDAIMTLLAHQLLLLDRSGDLRLHRGKTNGRYVAEANQSRPDAGQTLAGTVAAFDRSFFGRQPPVPEQMHWLWAENERLEERLAGGGEPASAPDPDPSSRDQAA